MRVLGLDPGLTCAGFGVVDEVQGRISCVHHGVIKTPHEAVQLRLATLYDQVLGLIRRHRPDAVSLERVIFNANARTAMSVAQAAGVCLVAAAQSRCAVAEYTPSEVKAAVAGHGGAVKGQVQKMVVRLLGLEHPPPPDAADALALAITHLHARRLKGLERGALSPA